MPTRPPRPLDEYYGWFVVCNDRVVMAADKTDRSVWGHGDFPRWHPQFRGFMGIVYFDAQDQRNLPWTTTKRDVDHSALVYRRAVAEMKKATQQFIEYTNARKVDLPEARASEALTKPTPVSALPLSENLVTPIFRKDAPRVRYTTIQYQKSQTDVSRVKVALGRSSMSNKEVGEKTFDYYVSQELTK